MLWKSWYRIATSDPSEHAIASRCLSLLALPYGLLQRRQARRRTRRPLPSPVPVVSVGNLTVGGTGKTPLVIEIGKFAQARGERVAVLLRGYGGRRGRRFLAASGGFEFMGVAQAGDEALLINRKLSSPFVLVHPDRTKTLSYAVMNLKPDVVLLDDGFAQRGIRRTLNLVTVDATAPFGNGRLFPAGLLREPVGAIAEADGVVITRVDQAVPSDLAALETRLRGYDLPLFRARYEPEGATEFGTGRAIPLGDLAAARVLAFSGIGNPLSFARTVRGLVRACAKLCAFRDHHPYTPAQVRRLDRAARRLGCHALLTTEKDAVRLPRVRTVLPLWILRVSLKVEEIFFDWLTEKLPSSR